MVVCLPLEQREFPVGALGQAVKARNLESANREDDREFGTGFPSRLTTREGKSVEMEQCRESYRCVDAYPD